MHHPVDEAFQGSRSWRRDMEPVEGKMERASNPGTIQTRLHRIAELASDIRPAGVRRLPSRSEPVCPKSRMREFRTSGSLGGLGG